MPKVKFRSHLQFPDTGGYMAFIHVPADFCAKFSGKKPPRIIITINKTISWKAAIMSLGNGNGFVGVSQKRIKEEGWKPGQPLEIQLEEDTDEETFPLPEEMAEILATDDEAHHYYKLLTDGKKRSITVYVNQPKNPQLRVDRAMLISKKLKAWKGKGNMIKWLKKTEYP